MNKLEVFDLPEPFTVANAASSFKITTIYVRGQELELAEVICGHLRLLWLASTFCATVALDWLFGGSWMALPGEIDDKNSASGDLKSGAHCKRKKRAN